MDSSSIQKQQRLHETWRPEGRRQLTVTAAAIVTSIWFERGLETKEEHKNLYLYIRDVFQADTWPCHRQTVRLAHREDAIPTTLACDLCGSVLNFFRVV